MSAHPADRARAALKRFARDEEGATLVEFALVIGIYLILFFTLIDFGRLAFHYVNAQRALQVAARIAAVRPAVCPGVPEVHTRGVTPKGEIEPDFGTTCNASGTTCANPGTFTCDGVATSATASEIWAVVQPALPNDAAIDNLSFSYAYDTDLGFLGGPYVPMITVELQDVTFEFISPLGAMAGYLTGTVDPNLGADITFPSLSTLMPGDDLAPGASG